MASTGGGGLGWNSGGVRRRRGPAPRRPAGPPPQGPSSTHCLSFPPARWEGWVLAKLRLSSSWGPRSIRVNSWQVHQ